MNRYNTPEKPWAFPHGGDRSVYGMTLRDYFAAAALMGAMASPQSRSGNDIAKTAEVFALVAYAMADAMLRERAK